MDKQELLDAGLYVCDPPPVTTLNWDDESWIKWIDHTGHWGRGLNEQKEKERIK